MRALLLIPIIVFLIFILKKTENYGEPNSQALLIGLGTDININIWLSSTNSGGPDAKLANSAHFKLQIGDLNRICWTDTTKCAGFRKQLQVGGGGPVWYLYTPNGNFDNSVPNGEQQVYSSPTLATVKGVSIPQFVIFQKSSSQPQSQPCVWTKTNSTCSAVGCGTTGTWYDTYNVTNYSSPCYGSENQALVAGTQTVSGAPCTAPACNLYDDGVPGTVSGGSGQSTLTATSITDCQVACTKKVGCKIIQFTAPSTCTGYTAKTSVTPGTGSTYVYTRVR